MSRSAHLLFVALAVVTFLLSPGTARADMTKAQCIDANTKGQDLRRDGKLSAAREVLRTCATPSCPAILSDDCAKRLDELDRAQPTIIFDAKDGSGRDLILVKVTVDGVPLADKLEGTALQVDPGEHVFVFTEPDQAPVTRTFVLKEGDKERRERVVIGPALVPAVTPQPSRASSSPPGESRGGMGTQEILGLVTGGVGVVGVVLGVVFGAMTLSEASQQQKDCASATNCLHYSEAASDHSTGATDRTISTVGFIAGGALIAGGAALFFTAGPRSEVPASTGLQLMPAVGLGSAGMLLKGEF
jgi:uncharacterized iron-regulated membrane protein